jgi:hypothetical protein
MKEMPGKHLAATIKEFTSYGLGNCFQRAVAMVMDRPRARLVIGTVTALDGHQYIHSWVEQGQDFYDPTRFEDDEELLLIDREHYIRSKKAVNIIVFTRKFVMDFAKQGNLSNWMLKTHVLNHQHTRSIGEELLTRAGYPYRVDDQGGILPL